MLVGGGEGQLDVRTVASCDLVALELYRKSKTFFFFRFLTFLPVLMFILFIACFYIDFNPFIRPNHFLWFRFISKKCFCFFPKHTMFAGYSLKDVISYKIVDTYLYR